MKNVDLSSIAGHIEFILAPCIGRENAMKRGVLLEKLMVIDSLTTDRQMRKAVLLIGERDGRRVCSCSEGYYFASSVSERSEAARYHVKKALGELARASRIDAGYLELEAFVQRYLPGMENRA